MKLKLSILDQSPIAMGANAAMALANSQKLAKFAEEAGYYSLMYAEHHGVKGYGYSSPELMAAITLSKTQHIKVGTGGIMMRNYSAYKIAEWAKLLATIYPERFILGLGKAPGGLRNAVMALNDDRLPTSSFPEKKLADIIRYLKEKRDTDVTLFAQPENLSVLPEILWLGSGGKSAREAAKYGVGYSYAGFMHPEQETDSTRTYYNEFNGNHYGVGPSLQIAIAVSVAENLQTARLNAYGMAFQFIQSRQLMAPDVLLPAHIVEKRVLSMNNEKMFLEALGQIIIETPQNIAGRLQEIAKKHNTDNILILSNMHSEYDRINTYRSIIKNNI